MTKLETPVAQVNGLVKRFKSNKHGDIDAIEIGTDEGTVDLKFPPHTAKSIMGAVAIGQPVIADYLEKTEPEKKPKLELQAIKAENQTEALTVGNSKPQKPSDTRVSETISPEKFTLVRDKKEEPIGIQIDNKLIHLHKEDKEIAAAIRPDSALTIQAVLRPDEGFVNEHNLKVYHIESIDIDGHTFHTSKKK